MQPAPCPVCNFVWQTACICIILVLPSLTDLCVVLLLNALLPTLLAYSLQREGVSGSTAVFAGLYLDVSFDLCTPAYCFFIDDVLY